MPQKTLRFKIHQDGRVEETVEGSLAIHVMKPQKILKTLSVKTVKNKTSEAFISNQIETLKQLNEESNVTF